MKQKNEFEKKKIKNHIRECGYDYMFLNSEYQILNHQIVDSRDDCVNIESLTKKR